MLTNLSTSQAKESETLESFHFFYFCVLPQKTATRPAAWTTTQTTMTTARTIFPERWNFSKKETQARIGFMCQLAAGYSERQGDGHVFPGPARSQRLAAIPA